MEFPQKVKEAYERLKREYKFFISLKKINGRFYLYKQTTVWNREKKKLKVISTYLGKITDDGMFLKKLEGESNDLEIAKQVIVAHGGKITMPEDANALKLLPIQEEPEDEKERKILMALSMNARIGASFLGRQIGVTPSIISNRIKNIEKKYKIKYTAEINLEKLAYGEFLVTVKFLGDIPSKEMLKLTFSKEPLIQLVMITKGEYDLLLYVLAKTNDDLKNLIIRLRTDMLAPYNSLWVGSPISKDFGFIPLRDEFIDTLKESMLKREYSVLKELNKNSTEEFAEIDRKY
ncbi:MAG: Lrp/AsnC family transcriptional regulator, partial [Nitrosotalea sp.]